MSWTPPPEFDGYRLIRPIGRGRMGHVYLAEDTLLRRPVAVKFLAAGEPNAEERERLLLEARAIARLQHPNVVAIYRVGEIDARPYLISEYVRGEPLDKVPRPIAPDLAVRVALGLARGLAAAHRSGVMHRDIKPANAILSEDGEAKLLDFGLAKLTDDLAPTSDGVPRRRKRSNASLTVVPAPRDARVTSTWPGARESVARAEAPLEVVPGGLARPENELLHAGPADQTISLVGEVRVPPPASAAAPDEPFSLTQQGAVLGTPLYMAPEAWRGEVATYRSDVYSLGALLHHLCTGKPVHERTTLPELRSACLDQDARPLAELAPALDRRLSEVIDRCLKRDPAARYASGEELRAALEALAPERQLAAIPEGNPYRGLHAFEAEHRGLFFGRDAEVRAVLDSLRTQPFVLVAGDSGVGKSSLIRAGVIPAVHDGALRGTRVWRSVSVVPGRRPVGALCAALAGALGADEEQLAARAANEPATLGREIRRHLGESRGLLVFVDQLEELLTLAGPEGKAAAQLLAYLAEPAPGLCLLATVRGDFLTRVAVLPGLGEQVSRALFILRPLARGNVREAITGPARATSVGFESEALVESLADSTADADGGLPLLQFALAELWEARDRTKRVMTEGSLKAIGGVVGALARHADGVLQGLLPEQRTAARRVLLELVTAEGTRARRPEAELVAGDASARAALDALVRGRLLVAREANEGTGYEVAHEALLKGWPTLRRWIDEDVETRVLRERLSAAANDWERLGQSRDALWGSRQLTEVAPLSEALLSARARAFLDASRAQVRRSQRVRLGLLGTLPLLLLAAWGGVRFKARRDLGRRVDEALTEARTELEATHLQRDREEALRHEALVQFDHRDPAAAEAGWARAQGLAAQLQAGYGRAASRLEAALALDPGRADVRAAFADLLAERALRADADHLDERRDELLERLRLYDDSGERMRALQAPGSLSLTLSPESATGRVERYAPGGRERTRVAELGPGAGPLSLPQGSYLVSLSAPGRAPVAYPVEVGRGEQLKLAVELPPAEAVPPDFVFVPAGRAWFGTSLPEAVRKNFLTTVPEHRVESGAFLIGRHEVTFGAWLEFLRALPPKEREARLHAEGGSGFTGQVGLKLLPDGRFQLSLQPGGPLLTAAEGERLVYPGRQARKEQDWLKLPVVGVSFEDAQAFVAWLDRSGKVPGARLCTELEWERAARGADRRLYPGGERSAPDDANFDDTYARDPNAIGPDEVGAHPNSRSPFGVDDLMGNVWELTTGVIGKDEIVGRGGAFRYDEFTDSAVNRQAVDSAQRDVTLGFRICAPLARAR